MTNARNTPDRAGSASRQPTNDKRTKKKAKTTLTLTAAPKGMYHIPSTNITKPSGYMRQRFSLIEPLLSLLSTAPNNVSQTLEAVQPPAQIIHGPLEATSCDENDQQCGMLYTIFIHQPNMKSRTSLLPPFLPANVNQDQLVVSASVASAKLPSDADADNVNQAGMEYTPQFGMQTGFHVTGPPFPFTESPNMTIEPASNHQQCGTFYTISLHQPNLKSHTSLLPPLLPANVNQDQLVVSASVTRATLPSDAAADSVNHAGM